MGHKTGDPTQGQTVIPVFVSAVFEFALQFPITAQSPTDLWEELVCDGT